MEVTTRKLSELHPYERNAKKHPEEQIAQITNSLKQFGWVQPVVVDENDVIIIGHGRVLAAKKLGLTECPTVKVDSLTEEQVKALRLADNKLNESEWDFELLNAELEDLVDFDMADFGFNADEPTTDNALSLDDVPDAPERTDGNICHCPKCGFEFEVKR